MHPSAIFLIATIFAKSSLRSVTKVGNRPICSLSSKGDVEACAYTFNFDPVSSYYKLSSTRESSLTLSWTSQALSSSQPIPLNARIDAWYNVTIPTNNAHLSYLTPDERTNEAITARVNEVGLLMNGFDAMQDSLHSLRSLAELNVLIIAILNQAKGLLADRQIDLSLSASFDAGPLFNDGVIG